MSPEEGQDEEGKDKDGKDEQEGEEKEGARSDKSVEVESQTDSDSDSDTENEAVVVRPPPNCARSHELEVTSNVVNEEPSSSSSTESSFSSEKASFWVCNRCEKTFNDEIRRWHCSKCDPPYFDVCFECHPEPATGSTGQPAQAEPENQTCGICWDELNDPRRLRCGHRYCAQCIESAISASVSSGDVLSLRCPDPSCRLDISSDPGLLNLIQNPELMGRYQQYLFVAKARVEPYNYHVCLNTGCGLAYPISLSPCPFCQAAMCRNCRQLEHSGSCKENFKRLRRTNRKKKGSLGQRFQKKRSEMWISFRTTPCPVCSTPIQKNKGCPHMNCKACNHHFCWKCHGDWNRIGGYSHRCFMRAHGTPGQVIGKVTKDTGLILLGVPLVAIGGAVAAVALIAAVPVLVIVGALT